MHRQYQLSSEFIRAHNPEHTFILIRTHFSFLFVTRIQTGAPIARHYRFFGSKRHINNKYQIPSQAMTMNSSWGVSIMDLMSGKAEIICSRSGRFDTFL